MNLQSKTQSFVCPIFKANKKPAVRKIKKEGKKRSIFFSNNIFLRLFYPKFSFVDDTGGGGWGRGRIHIILSSRPHLYIFIQTWLIRTYKREEIRLWKKSKVILVNCTQFIFDFNVKNVESIQGNYSLSLPLSFWRKSRLKTSFFEN